MLLQSNMIDSHMQVVQGGGSVSPQGDWDGFFVFPPQLQQKQMPSFGHFYHQQPYFPPEEFSLGGCDQQQQQGELSRASHNVLERMRRNDLKHRFNVLRDNIPELNSHKRAPKIQILEKGLQHMKMLKSEEQRLLVDLELEKQRKKILLKRLHDLNAHTRLYAGFL